MATNPHENLFIFMQSLGHLQEYSDYNDYRRKKYGIDNTAMDKLIEFENWKKSLPEEERKQFDLLFG